MHYLTVLFDIKLSEFFSLLLSSLTLLLAYRIYKNFDIKKSHVNKQLNTVLQLIEEINQCLIPVSFWRKIPENILAKLPEHLREKKATLESWHYSLFTIASLDNAHQKFQDIYLSAGVKLSEFYSPFTQYTNFERASERYVELKSAKMEGTELLLQFPDLIDTYKSWDNFILASKNLKLEIEKWLNKYGSKDVNFNTYFQSPDK
jgi:hypothetical protein